MSAPEVGGAVEARLRVIYGDTDQMGVVYYANYLRYFELSRSEYFRARGGSYAKLEQEGYGLPVIEAHAEYRASARYDDVLVVTIRLVELRRASLRFDYEIRREGEQKVLCEGHTVHACVGKDGRPRGLPAEVLERLARDVPGKESR
jgi:acyl-CoA thioester hydrolase